ncbi:MAG: aldehyde dehydrogenase family protein [Actinobacteria bacterium]|nr:aldehyde dehydrogenase family protein [Actinomycetota bacterium]
MSLVSSPHAPTIDVPEGVSHIDGKPAVHPDDGELMRLNPATGTPLGAVALAGEAGADHAVSAARAALAAWRGQSAAARRSVLLRIADTLEENSVELAALQTLEMGQIFKATRFAASAAAEWFRYYAGWVDKLDGAVASFDPADSLDYTVAEPYGVVAAIVPFNGPLIAASLKLAPALAAGNTVVLKPSELAPFSLLRMAALCEEAGLPPGVLNILTGGGEAGQALCRHPDVDKISFTGGPVAAKAVGMAAVERYVPLLMELGGKSAAVVFADTDPASAGRLAATLALAQNAGQGCFLPTRLLVERPIYDAVVDAAVATAAGYRLGDPFDPATKIGPVVSESACQRIVSVMERARAEKHGRLCTGGGRPGGDLAAGSFVEPTIFADVDNTSPLAQDEIFGPVLAITAFDDEDEAVALANGTGYGLAGYVHTRDLARSHRVAGRLEAGYVSVNGMALLAPSAPFGGWKGSGFGTEGGRRGIEEFQRVKNVYVSLR